MLSLGLLLCGGCSSLNSTRVSSALATGLQAVTVGDAQIADYSRQFIAANDLLNSVAPADDPYSVRLNRITAPLAGSGLNIKVYKTDDVNAFATADGSIRVYSGLMDIMSDEEVLGVIGHEIGHVKLHHTRKSFQAALMTSAVRDQLSSQSGMVGTLSKSAVGDLAESLSSTQYSQKDEREADDYGYEFLKAHGLNPWAMALSFEKLKQMEQQAGGNASGPILQLFSTHPDLDSRIKRMADRATKDGYSAGNAGQSTVAPPSSGPGEWSF